MRAFEDFSTEEVCMFVIAIGLGSKLDGFKENGVDGSLLVTLSEDDLKSDLGLSGLQAKKILNGIKDFRDLTSGAGGGGSGVSDEEYAKLLQQVEALQQENSRLKAEIRRLRPPAPSPAPAPRPAPAPAPAHAPTGRPVIREGARGAARGAVLGAIGGAIAGDPGQGAKIGAAIGGTAGGMRGIGARRRMMRG